MRRTAPFLLVRGLAAAMVERRETRAHLFQQSTRQAIGEAFTHRAIDGVWIFTEFFRERIEGKLIALHQVRDAAI